MRASLRILYLRILIGEDYAKYVNTDSLAPCHRWPLILYSAVIGGEYVFHSHVLAGVENLN